MIKHKEEYKVGWLEYADGRMNMKFLDPTPDLHKADVDSRCLRSFENNVVCTWVEADYGKYKEIILFNNGDIRGHRYDVE